MKRTAANTPLLKTVKRIFNKPIYQHSLQICNEQGEDAVYAYLQQFFTGDVKTALVNVEAVLNSPEPE